MAQFAARVEVSAKRLVEAVCSRQQGQSIWDRQSKGSKRTAGGEVGRRWMDGWPWTGGAVGGGGGKNGRVEVSGKAQVASTDSTCRRRRRHYSPVDSWTDGRKGKRWRLLLPGHQRAIRIKSARRRNDGARRRLSLVAARGANSRGGQRGRRLVGRARRGRGMRRRRGLAGGRATQRCVWPLTRWRVRRQGGGWWATRGPGWAGWAGVRLVRRVPVVLGRASWGPVGGS